MRQSFPCLFAFPGLFHFLFLQPIGILTLGNLYILTINSKFGYERIKHVLCIIIFILSRSQRELYPMPRSDRPFRRPKLQNFCHFPPTHNYFGILIGIFCLVSNSSDFILTHTYFILTGLWTFNQHLWTKRDALKNSLECINLK